MTQNWKEKIMKFLEGREEGDKDRSGSGLEVSEVEKLP